MESNLNLRRHEHSKSPDMTEPTTPSGHQRHLREKVVDEFSILVILLGYLWVVFELLSIHKSLILSQYHLDYPEHAFAIINALVFAKVLLTRNCVWDIVLKLSRYVRTRRTTPGPRERGRHGIIVHLLSSLIGVARIRICPGDQGGNRPTRLVQEFAYWPVENRGRRHR